MDGKTILPRSEVPEEFTWDLRDVFASDEAWNDELEALKAYPERMAAFVGDQACGVRKLPQRPGCGQLLLSGHAQQSLLRSGRTLERQRVRSERDHGAF